MLRSTSEAVTLPHTSITGGGDCGDLVRSYDWAATCLGPAHAWPQSLRTTVGLVLLSHVPMVLLWGEDGVMIYNDAYSGFAGGRHPQLLGSKVREGWPEVADFNDNVMRVGLSGGTLGYKDQELTLYRHGRPEQVWMNLDYSPVLDEGGRPAGVLCILAETTERVAAERQRAQAEAAVRDSEERFRALVNASSDLVYRMSPDWTELRQLDGRGILVDTDGPSIGWLETYVFDADRPRVMAAIDEAVRTLGVLKIEHRVLRADGTPGVISSRAVPMLDEAGRLVEWFGAASDVTERDQAMSERVASDERLRAALDASDTGTFRWDIRTNALDWDEALDRLFGLSPGDTARSLDQFITMVHPDDRAGVIERCQACAGDGADFEMEFRVVHPDGSLRWLYDRGKTFRDPDGTPAYMAGACVDITERREAEERLIHTTRRLDAILGNATQAIFLMDERQHCAYMNRAAEVLTGYSLDEVLARDCPLHDIVHHTRPDGSPFPLCECPIDQAFPENNQEQGEEIFVHKDGTFYPVAFTASPIRDETGRPIGTVIEARNIEAELRDRAALEGFNANLERRVAEEMAARESAEAALRQSQKMEAVGQLTGGLAHDFNNLLAGISGSLELMQTRMSQGRLTDLDRYMAAAQGAAKRAAALTHRLLAFSRRQTLDPKPTNVNALVAGIEELIRRTVGPEITLEVVGAAGLWTALVDPNQLENALLNLCINARDAMPDGGRITIETANRWLDDRAAKERDLPPGQYLSLCVSDSGTGMSADVIAKAFDPFFTTKPLGQGTGLGLSMIYGFARQSGGQVRIYSEIGQGTTVCLYLPRHAGDVSEAEVVAHLADAPRAEQGETVLIVDDEPTVRMLVTEVLEDLGYTAIEAADGPSGLKVLQSDVRIDLLITDVGLPGGMNGRQMADAARVKRPDLKVLFITGFAENAAVGNGHLEPGMAVLTKPFVMETLASRIREMIEA